MQQPAPCKTSAENAKTYSTPRTYIRLEAQEHIEQSLLVDIETVLGQHECWSMLMFTHHPVAVPTTDIWSSRTKRHDLLLRVAFHNVLWTFRPYIIVTGIMKRKRTIDLSAIFVHQRCRNVRHCNNFLLPPKLGSLKRSTQTYIMTYPIIQKAKKSSL